MWLGIVFLCAACRLGRFRTAGRAAAIVPLMNRPADALRAQEGHLSYELGESLEQGRCTYPSRRVGARGRRDGAVQFLNHARFLEPHGRTGSLRTHAPLSHSLMSWCGRQNPGQNGRRCAGIIAAREAVLQRPQRHVRAATARLHDNACRVTSSAQLGCVCAAAHFDAARLRACSLLRHASAAAPRHVWTSARVLGPPRKRVRCCQSRAVRREEEVLQCRVDRGAASERPAAARRSCTAAARFKYLRR